MQFPARVDSGLQLLAMLGTLERYSIVYVTLTIHLVSSSYVRYTTVGHEYGHPTLNFEPKKVYKILQKCAKSDTWHINIGMDESK